MVQSLLEKFHHQNIELEILRNQNLHTNSESDQLKTHSSRLPHVFIPPDPYWNSFSGISTNQGVTHGIYQTFKQHEESDNESINQIPQPSEDPNIYVISENNFELNKEWLREDFYHKDNIEKKDWFFNTFPDKTLIEIRKHWYTDMENLKTNISFYKWYEIYASNHRLDCPWKQK